MYTTPSYKPYSREIFFVLDSLELFGPNESDPFTEPNADCLLSILRLTFVLCLLLFQLLIQFCENTLETL